MNRWRQRLDELRGGGSEPAAPLSITVQDVQNVQNPLSELSFERFEQIEQPTEPQKLPARAADRAFATWGEGKRGRAAIVQHDGDILREWAEGFARLDPDRAPGDVPLKRWHRFVEDVGLFLASPFCASAAALGWGSYDLFGCDRERPFDRIDQAGLLWLLNGERLVMLTAKMATIETRTRARQTWNRKPDEPGRALAWEVLS